MEKRKMGILLTVNHYGERGVTISEYGSPYTFHGYAVNFAKKDHDSLSYGAGDYTYDDITSDAATSFLNEYININPKCRNSMLELQCISYERVKFGPFSIRKPFPKGVRNQLEAIVKSHIKSLQQSAQVHVHT